MANNISKTTPPLAGRPPFATDEPDSIYANSPSTQTRQLRQPRPQDNRPDSTYDNYLNEKHDPTHARQSGYGDIGAGLLNGDIDDDSDDETIAYHGDIKKDSSEERIPPPPSFNNFPSVPIMAPKPGYAAPVSALTMPEPAATPVGQQRAQQMPSQMRQQPSAVAPISILQAPSVPSTPHPLQPPMTPITPAFARPPQSANNDKGGVKFEPEAIMRAQKEDLPLARRGQKGDDFWRRFSMVVKEEGSRKSGSSWLEKTQNASANMSRMIWIIGILLLIIIGGAIGFGVYVSHNSDETTRVKALGGSDGQGADLSIVPTTAAGATSTNSGVRPTLTVDKRYAMPYPMPEPTPGVMHVVHAHVKSHHVTDSSNSSNLSTKPKRLRRSSKRRLL